MGSVQACAMFTPGEASARYFGEVFEPVPRTLPRWDDAAARRDNM
jgi:hypothetical protein